VDILLVEQMAPEARAWLEGLHSVESRPELAGDASALRKAIYKAQAVVLPRKVVVTREFLDFAPLLKAVARIHVGTDNTDLEACRDRRVRVIQASTANVRSNAEYLLAAVLMLYRRGIGAPLAGDRHAEVRMGRELNGSTVGILGLAPTAHTFALMLHALGAKLIGYDPAVHHTAPIWSRLHVRPASLQEVISHSDAVSVQVGVLGATALEGPGGSVNLAARNLYAEHGYHELAITRGYYRCVEDAVRLEKHLPRAGED